MKQIYLLDDDVFFNQSLCKLLTKNDYKVEGFYSASSCFEFIEKNGRPDLVVTDFRLPDSDGLSVISKIKQLYTQTPVILITNYSNIRTAVKSIKLGAFEFVSKPIIPEEFLKVINQALKTNQFVNPQKNIGLNLIKGNTINHIWSHLDVVAPTDLSVLITGESGTGKELVAQYIHQNSKRSKFKFVAIDCGALPEETVLSELFGHEKGAFTGATQAKTGQFEYADKGTIFLDEVGNLSYSSQIKLLRAIQEKSIKRLGSNSKIDVDVRIIAATNEVLNEAIENNNFRLDLFHRLNEFPIEIPPLRDRINDLELFIDFFGNQAASELKKQYKGISANLLNKFKNHSWPGNLRELKNLITRGLLLSNTGLIDENNLPNFSKAEAIPQKKQHSLKVESGNLEKKMIEDALIKNKYNKTKAAEELNITRSTLYKKIKEHKINI